MCQGSCRLMLILALSDQKAGYFNYSSVRDACAVMLKSRTSDTFATEKHNGLKKD